MSEARIGLSIGPLYFNWAPARITEFYDRLATETAVDRVYLGEVVCGKRAPLLTHALAEAAERLEREGKEVVWSSLALPATPRDRMAVRTLAAQADPVEINDLSALLHRDAKSPFVAGPLLNVYNEDAARELAAHGCVRLCANVELSLAAVGAIGAGCPGLELELFAFGRLPLAISGRCYHARAHGLHRDSCQFVCDRDPDGMDLRTLEGAPFLAVNGVQTLSHGVHLACPAPAELRHAGVTALRLSPHSLDMVGVANGFRRFLDGEIDAETLQTTVVAAGPPGPLVNGYVHGRAGLDWTG